MFGLSVPGTLGFVSVGAGVFGLVVVGVVGVVGVVVVGVVGVGAGVLAGGVVCVGVTGVVVVIGVIVVGDGDGAALGALWADRRRVLLVAFVVPELLGAVAGTRTVLVTGTFTLTTCPLGSTRRTVSSRCTTTRF